MSRLNISRLSIERDELEDLKSIEKIDKYIFGLFLFGLTLIPLIVSAKAQLFVSPLISGTGITSSGNHIDFFTYFKFSLLIIITFLTLILFLYKLYFLNYKIKWNIFNYSLVAFIIALIISVIFAEYKSIALWGLYNRHDGALTFISYAVLMFVAHNIRYNKQASAKIVYTLYPFIWINVVIAVLNLFNINLLQNTTIFKLFTLFLAEDIELSEGSVLTGTLNQWNYMSGYSAVMAIIFLSLAIFNGTIKSKIINLLTSIASFITILASTSTSGFITLLFMSVVIVFLILLKQNKKKSVSWFISFIVIASMTTILLSIQNPKVWTESVGFFTKTNPFVPAEEAKVQNNKQNLGYNEVIGSELSEFSLPNLPERTLSGGSGRIYIWRNTLPLIKESILTGYGLDTLTYHFPQHDINKRDGFWDENVYIDKPHNLYLGILYGTGILGFTSFLFIITVLILGTYKILLKNKDYPIIWAFILGWTAFLLQAIFNDSVIGATIVPLLATTIIYTITTNVNNLNFSEE